jgi:hypothetical protein
MWTLKIAYIFLFSLSLYAKILNVPSEYSSIQAAINDAVNGDTVLVESGTYFENINFNGKNIVIESFYAITGDLAYIDNTIIDGSNPIHSDSASCVRIVSGENTSAVLDGFTLTGGKGTKWIDEHGAGVYVEGGGIFSALSSPTIKNNKIIFNEAINSPSGTVSAGGGAIRCGDGSPQIFNNIIIDNKGMYGGGIVLNYCSNAIVQNNIIANNEVEQFVSGKPTFGGGGLWMNNSLPGNDLPNIITNNTIIGNLSNTFGGGIYLLSANALIRNNIVWTNVQQTGTDIKLDDANMTAEYNDINGDVIGTGNININPAFSDSGYYLQNTSPCIDAGDPSPEYNDPEDPNSTGNALFPAQGTLRNDMGVYGGPLSNIFPEFSSPELYLDKTTFDFGLTLPNEPITILIPLVNIGAGVLIIESANVLINDATINIANGFPINVKPVQSENLILTWTPLVKEDILDTLFIFHNDPDLINPLKIILTGSSFPNALIFFDNATYDFGDVDVNTPSIDTTLYVYNNGTATDSIYTSIIYQVVTPDSALSLSPAVFEIEAKDSAAITFSIFPSIIHRTGFNLYQPKIVVDSRFGIGTTHFEKLMKFHLIGVLAVDEEGKLPLRFNLEQNYPNPFNPTTIIKYSLPEQTNVQLKIFNILGQEVATLVNEEKSAGNYTVSFDAKNLSSGVYFYKLQAEKYSQTNKMLLIR